VGDPSRALSREEVWKLREYLPEEAKRWVEEFEKENRELYEELMARRKK